MEILTTGSGIEALFSFLDDLDKGVAQVWGQEHGGI